MSRLTLRRAITVTVAGALVTGGLIAASTSANAGGMTVITPRGTTSTFTTALTTPAGIEGIAADKNGGAWFAERSTGKYGHITSNGVITEYPIMGLLREMALGPDGNVWMSDQSGNVRRIKPDGTADVFTNTDMQGSQPFGIAAGPDGAMWVTGAGVGKIFRVSMTGTITTFSAGSEPTGITAGPDGAMWFVDFNNYTLSRITMDGSVDVVASGFAGRPAGVAAGPDHNLWVTELTGAAVDRVQLDGTVTKFALGSSFEPWGITAGPDGAMWVADSFAGAIARVAMDGHVAQYAAGSSVHHLAVATDGSLWLGGDSAVVRMTTGLAGAPASASAVAGNGSANVSWTVPFDSGLNNVSQYRVTATPGGASCLTGFTTCQINGLKNGTAYRFTVQAANSIGFGPASATTTPVTPKAAPSVPRTLTVKFPKKGSVIVSWKVPVAANGAPITGYLVKWTIPSSGATTAWTATAKTTITKAGFVKGQKISVQVRAVNGAGTSPIATLKYTQGK